MLNKHHSLGTPPPPAALFIFPWDPRSMVSVPTAGPPGPGLRARATVVLRHAECGSCRDAARIQAGVGLVSRRDPKGGLPLEATFASVLPPGTLVPVLRSWALASALPYGAVSSGGPPGASTGGPPRWHLAQAGPGEEPFSVERCAECTGASLPWTLLPSQ